METVFERVGALDVHKAPVTACLRVPGPGGRRTPHLAEFSTTTRHPASWAGRCPGNDQSAGKRRSARTRNGSERLAKALEEPAI